ncbi:MAG TPA: hypothetical protein VFQ53_20145 [Kofleriaceae bacterium]|nr:hypothetical protein [Kofleriaceae bacterium]
MTETEERPSLPRTRTEHEMPSSSRPAGGLMPVDEEPFVEERVDLPRAEARAW